MNKKYFLRYGLFWIVGFLSVLLLSYPLLPLPFSLPAIAQTRPTPVTLTGRTPSAQSFQAFGLTSTLTPLIPGELRRSNQPNGGSRGVIGLTDDRVPMTSFDYPWSAIGRIEYLSGDEFSICTGSLVAPDIVLTNAHCIIDMETHQPKAGTKFAPNLIDGLVQDEEDLANVVDLIRGTDFRNDNQMPHPDDWAFLRLDRPLGERYGTLAWQPLPVSTLVREYGSRLTLVGYSGDFPPDDPASTAGAHVGCSILGEVEDNLIHDCDMFGGSSGGPILAEVDGEFRIVALNAAELYEEGELDSGERIRQGIVNYGVKISRITNLIQQYVTR
ncbi:trypsin-like peptidase domain-containing protein [Oscillatoria sp. FACHB-1407]|uniref:trypsin-like serine peptidase n=1 Tax=Oscillatoria sp. FACHB-1407 TaxID=2692847 RepID=UPI001686F74E|nr:trypsin-like peptidase domain-containing protein [Oscillatoria sp. FACHB-1407]MBD2459913.1 trypsin-like peptidase domain-containing protein [Oscillatoria sp. FACHB-1407]